MPSPSGPRCTIVSVMRRTWSGLTASPERPIIPAIPHIVPPVRGLRVPGHRGSHLRERKPGRGLHPLQLLLACGRSPQSAAGLPADRPARSLQTSETLLHRYASTGTTANTSQTYPKFATWDLRETPSESRRPVLFSRCYRSQEWLEILCALHTAESLRSIACATASAAYAGSACGTHRSSCTSCCTYCRARWRSARPASAIPVAS